MNQLCDSTLPHHDSVTNITTYAVFHVKKLFPIPGNKIPLRESFVTTPFFISKSTPHVAPKPQHLVLPRPTFQYFGPNAAKNLVKTTSNLSAFNPNTATNANISATAAQVSFPLNEHCKWLCGKFEGKLSQRTENQSHILNDVCFSTAP